MDSKVDNSAIRPNDESGQAVRTDRHATNNIAIGQHAAIGRRNINARDDHCEMGHGSDGKIGPFMDAIEDESSDEEFSVDSPDNCQRLDDDSSIGATRGGGSLGS